MATETTRAGDRRFDPRAIATALGFVLAVNAVGAAPSLVASPNTAWFRALEKPVFYPPGWLFGVVWTILFTLMGVALFLVVRQGLDAGEVRFALGLFLVQLVFNVAWTPTFFRLEALLAALAIVAALFVLVVATIGAFARVDRRAAALLVPYLLWVGFATVLTYSIWSLNA